MSQHRFREAIDIVTRAPCACTRTTRGTTASPVMRISSSASTTHAFDAFDTMARQRPDAAAYARIAYAQELQGHLDAAIASMRMAAEATGAQDPESLAWHYAQIGNLLLQTGDVDGAAREFARAGARLPRPSLRRSRPCACRRRRGQSTDALTMYLALMKTAPTSDTAIAGRRSPRAARRQRGSGCDVRARRGNRARGVAERNAVDDETWRACSRSVASARARRCSWRRKPRGAGKTSSRWTRWRGRTTVRDAFTDAEAASRQARRTGTVDRRILAHAAAIDKSAAALTSRSG